MKRMVEYQIDADNVGVDSPIINIVSKILKLGVDQGARLMTFSPCSANAWIDIVCIADNENFSIKIVSSTHKAICAHDICSRLKIASGMNISENKISQVGTLNLKLRDIDKPFVATVTTIPFSDGEAIVISFNCLPRK